MNKRKHIRNRGHGKRGSRLFFATATAVSLTLLMAAALPSHESILPNEPPERQQIECLTKNAPKASAPIELRQVPEIEDWQLVLVNPWNPIPKGYRPILTPLKNGQAVDERCYPDLQAMMDACRAAGLSPVICSSYRTQEKQEQLFYAQVDRLVAKGLAPEDAWTETGRSIALPGTSEHQLGLAIDIVDLNNQNLNESQENTPVQKWLMEHCWEFGFILRYPSEKSEVTGIIYEPRHYRYVGYTAAREIYEQDICLEEYLKP